MDQKNQKKKLEISTSTDEMAVWVENIKRRNQK